MNLKRTLGLDILSERYTYEHDPAHGWVSSSRAADRWVPTTCGYCSVGCGILIGVKENRAVAVRGNPEHPVNRGKLCPKGLSEHHTLAASTRAHYPLLRKQGKLVRVSWDEALDTMVSRFREIRKKHGPGALGVLSTGQLVTEEFYALGKLVQLGFGTRHYDGNTTLCMASAVSGYKRSFGSDGPPGSYEDLETADVILLMGANIADNHPILCARLERNTSATVIVADPRVTKTAMLADIYLPLQPRSDIALLNGIAHILIRDGLIDRDYIDRHTTGFEDLAASANKYTPGHVATLTGLSIDQIERTAQVYGRAKAAFIGWTMGVNHSTQGTDTVNAINNLALLTGQLGRPGATAFSITGQCNAMGSREASFTSSLPGYRKFENEQHRAELARLGASMQPEFPRGAGSRIPTSSKRPSAKAFARCGSSPPTRLSRSPTMACCSRRWKTWIFSWCRTGFIPRPLANAPTSCCRPRSGAKKRARTPTPNGASVR